MPIQKIEDIDQFNKEIGSSEDVIVKFEADWCGPCKAVKPLLEEAAKQKPEVKFISVDIEGDGFETVLAEYGVRSVPTFVRVKSGKPIASAVGAISRKELKTFIDKDDES